MTLPKTIIIPPFYKYKTSSWWVYNPQGRPPTYPHQTVASAENEAKRLAALNKGQEFYLVQMSGIAYDVQRGFKSELIAEVEPEFRVGEKYVTSEGNIVTVLSTTSRNWPGHPLLTEDEVGILRCFTLKGTSSSSEYLLHKKISKEKMTVLVPQEGLLRTL